MSRIVILSAFLTPQRSGAEACAEEIAQELSAAHDVTVVTARLRTDLPREDTFGAVRVLRVGWGMPLDKWLFPLLGALSAWRLHPDLVHAVLESYAGLALVLCRTLVPNARRVLTCQSTNTTLLLQSMHRAANAVTVISSVLQKRAAALGRADAVLIPNGIRFAEMRAACEGVPKVKGRVLFVGRLERMKGVDVLLRALAELGGGLRPDVHIVGDGSERRALERQALQLQLHGVRFLGRLSGEVLQREYAEAQVFCGLSRSEALGNVFLEAQAAGCAVLATREGGIPDIVQDGTTGVLVRPEDPTEAAEALRRLLTDDVWRETLAAAGPGHAAGYDWADLAKRYAAVYDRVCSAHA